MSSQHIVIALGKVNPRQHEAAITTLQDVEDHKSLTKCSWKPVQRGIILSRQ